MKEIVIKISEDAYDYLINTHFVENTKYMFNQSVENRKHTMQLFEVIEAVKNGTPLPEHHGDLIDRDAIEVLRIGNIKREYDKGFDAGVNCMVNRILDAPTIIEEGSGTE